MKLIESSLEGRGLKGNVRFLEEKTYYAVENSGKIEKGGFKSGRFLSFNEDGNLLLEVSDSKDFSSKDTYIYDSKGDLIKKRLSNNYNCTYVYDYVNNIIEETCYYDSVNIANEYIYQDDSNGNLIEEKPYDSERDYMGRTIYKYDSNGKLIEENEYYEDDDNEILNKKCVFDSRGYMTEENDYDEDGDLKQKWTYNNTYNSDGKLIEGSIFDKDGKLISKSFFKYDSKGNRYKYITYDSDGKLFSNLNYIEFDDKNNWITCTEMFKDRLEIIIRQIDYYGEDN